MSDRDPRIDPRPDDQVRVEGETREVCAVHNGRVVYSWPGVIAVRSHLLRQWQRWAEGAEIVKVAHTQ